MPVEGCSGNSRPANYGIDGHSVHAALSQQFGGGIDQPGARTSQSWIGLACL
ncbi:hypothetical protein [Nocardia nova]|uniref:hypothetical protein n=1 Tax=Nocardia nova TaxID=37330 RepID=UPI003015423F